MNKDNSRVPSAVLSCFLIAFILQGVLKISGILVFEKALNWEIFSIIDNNKWLQVIYYSFISFVAVYCLSFALTKKPYSNKWYHYIIMIITTVCVMAFRLYGKYTPQQNLFMDTLLYILVPFIIAITTDRKYRLFEDLKIFNIVIILTINISLYFCYLGLTYWSNLVTSLLPITTIWVNSSTMFLINFEIYIGLITCMLSMNILISKFKEKCYMNMPVNIATTKAKLEAKEKVLAKKIDKNISKAKMLNEQLLKVKSQLEELKSKENEKK